MRSVIGGHWYVVRSITRSQEHEFPDNEEIVYKTFPSIFKEIEGRIVVAFSDNKMANCVIRTFRGKLVFDRCLGKQFYVS
jgi:hypothetical protein